MAQIWGENRSQAKTSELLLKVAQCAAEDELFLKEGIETEHIELVIQEAKESAQKDSDQEESKSE